MGAEQSTVLRSMGEVDGNPVEFKYTRDEVRTDDLSKQCLSYRLEDTNNITTISGLDIIAVLPVNAEISKDCNVLYVQPPPKDPESEAARKQPKRVTLFRSIVATSLPQQFVQDYTPSERSFWQLYSDKDEASAWPNLHIIVSTKSGTGLAEAHFVHLVKPLLAQLDQHEGTDYEVHHTESERSVIELATSVLLPRAHRGVNQTIVLMSGDGGIVDFVNALFTRGRQDGVTTEELGSTYVKPCISLLPMGTGNALAHSIGITRDHTVGLSSMLRGAPQILPMFRAAFSPGARVVTAYGTQEESLPVDEQGTGTLWGAVVCSWGMHAALVADSDTEEYRQYGAERFKMAAKEAIFPTDGSEPHRYKGKVSVLRKRKAMAIGVETRDDGPETQREDNLIWEVLDRQEYAYVLTTMVSNLEEGFTISPHSKAMDGKLRLVHFGPMDGQKIMEIMGLAYQDGKHVDNEAVNYEDIEGLRIAFEGREINPRWRRICVDGKIVRLESDGWVELSKETTDVVDLVCMA